LYVVVPPGFVPADVAPQLRHLFYVTNRSAYERNMHALEIAHEVDAPDFAQRAEPVIALGRASGFAVILRGKGDATARLAQALSADGVLLDELEHIARARAILGEDAIIGLRCGLSPERADEARDAGADYVSFGYPGREQLPPEDIVKLWAWSSEKPVLVEGPVTNDDIDDFVKAGATFFDCGGYIFGHPDGVMQGTVNMLYAIDLALGVQS
jgi:thiamine-phosphate pyrophosphorylase